MTTVYNYDPLRVVGSWKTETFGTIDIVDGAINPGDFATTSKDNPRWSREFDLAGNTTRVKNNNRGGSVTITLSASSSTNRRLSILAEIDDLTSSVVGTLILKDLNGGTVVRGLGAFLEDIPAPNMGTTRGSHAWTWQCASLRTHLEGRDPA